jgi:hypothetical protein
MLLPLYPVFGEVWIGRGKTVNAHPGNHKLRAIVETEVAAYSKAKNRAAKTNIIAGIFRAIRADSHIGFVKRDPCTKKFFAVEDTTAKITIAQYFRDALADQEGYKSSKRYKQKLRDALKRSHSDCGQDNEDMITAANRTMLRRCSSAGNPQQQGLQLQQMPLTVQVTRALFQTDNDTKSVPMEATVRQVSGLPVGTGTATRAGNALQAVHHVLQSAADLLEDDDYSDMEETIDWAVDALSRTEPKIPSSDVFSSLYNAFGSDPVMTPNPYEPTPINESSSKLNGMDAAPTPQQETSPGSPFYFDFEGAFGCRRDQATV